MDNLLKIPFFRLGVWKHPLYGDIKGDKGLFAAIIKNFRDNTVGRPVFVRLGHDKDSKSTFGDAPAEAWVKDVAEENGVLYAIAEPTTDKILDQVKTGRYRYASAEYTPNYIDKETGQQRGPVLTAIALTNEPFLTRLPESQVLADPPDTIYLDFAEVKKLDENLIKENNNLLKKLTDIFGGLINKDKLDNPDGNRHTDAATLAELNATKQKLADAETQIKAAEDRQKQALAEKHKTDVEAKLADLVAKGIFPAMCDKAKILLLAIPPADTVKLSDGQEKPLPDLIYDILLALPEERRIKLGQDGRQEMRKPGESAAEIYGDVVPALKKGSEK